LVWGAVLATRLHASLIPLFHWSKPFVDGTYAGAVLV
jgi:hypothetical protein